MILRGGGDAAAPAREAGGCRVHAAGEEESSSGMAKAGEDRAEGRLAAAGGAFEKHAVACADFQGAIGECVAIASRIGVEDIANFEDFAGWRDGGFGVAGFVILVRRGCEEFADDAPGLPGAGELRESENEAAEGLIAEDDACNGDRNLLGREFGGSAFGCEFVSDGGDAERQPAARTHGDEPRVDAIHARGHSHVVD